jgi:hypothetical protein
MITDIKFKLRKLVDTQKKSTNRLWRYLMACSINGGFTSIMLSCFCNFDHFSAKKSKSTVWLYFVHKYHYFQPIAFQTIHMYTYILANILQKHHIHLPDASQQVYFYSPTDEEMSHGTTHKNRIDPIFAVRHHAPYGTNSLPICRTV